MLFFCGHLIVSRPLIFFHALLSSKQVICFHVIYLRCIALVFYFYSSFYSIDLTKYCQFNSIESASFQVSYRKRSATPRCYEKSDHQKSSLPSWYLCGPCLNTGKPMDFMNIDRAPFIKMKILFTHGYTVLASPQVILVVIFICKG